MQVILNYESLEYNCVKYLEVLLSIIIILDSIQVSLSLINDTLYKKINLNKI